MDDFKRVVENGERFVKNMIHVYDILKRHLHKIWKFCPWTCISIWNSLFGDKLKKKNKILNFPTFISFPFHSSFLQLITKILPWTKSFLVCTFEHRSRLACWYSVIFCPIFIQGHYFKVIDYAIKFLWVVSLVNYWTVINKCKQCVRCALATLRNDILIKFTFKITPCHFVHHFLAWLLLTAYFFPPLVIFLFS